MRQKQRELFESISARTVLLRAPDPNFYYFSQLSFNHFEGNALVLRKGKKPLLFTTRFYKVPASQRKRLEVRKAEKSSQAKRMLSRLTRKRKVGINAEAVSKKRLQRWKKQFKPKRFIDVSEQLGKARARKLPFETGRAGKAAKITQKVLASVPSLLSRGMTEKQLALEIETRLRERADNSVPFPLIVASARNAGIPHHLPGHKKIGKGFLLIDAGCRCRNYASDLSRTFFVGKAGKKEKALYSAVRQAQQHAIDSIKPGASCGKIFADAGDFLKKKTGKPLIHGLGHGLGIETHDFPSGFLPGSKEKLERGMLLTVEPAVYGVFGGIRVEDDVLVTARGCRRLSTAPKELIEVRGQ